MEQANLQSVKERLKFFIGYKKMSIRAFESQCGLSFGFVGNMRNSMQPDKVMKIAQQFPDLNTGWLMTGEGEMLLSSINQNNVSGPNVVGENTTNNNQISKELLEIIKDQKEELKKRDEQVDRLITLIEKLTGK